jgi:hypothetical protein
VKFQILDFRHTAPMIQCDCGANDFETSEEAVEHVIDEHAEENTSEDVALAKAAKLLSPNPIHFVRRQLDK